jgi:WD40 repeat protein
MSVNILSQDVALLYPTPNTKIYPSEIIDIRWSNPNQRNVDLFYRLDNNNWQLIAENLTTDTYSWEVPQSTSESVSFKVQYSSIRKPDLMWHKVDAHTDEVRSGMFSPSGNFLVTTSRDNFLRFWDIENREMVHEVDLSRIGTLNYGIPFSDTKAFAAVEEYLVLVDFSGGNIIKKVINIGSVVMALDYTPSHGGLVAATSKTGKVYIFDTDFNYIKELSSNGSEEIYSVRFSHDGSQICMGNFNGFVDCYDYETNDLILSRSGHGTSPGLNSVIWSVDITADNSKVTTGGTDRTVRLWDKTSDDALQIFDSHTSHVRSIRTSPNDDLLISGSLDGNLRFYNTEGLYEFNLITTSHGSPVLSVDISTDGNYAASSGRGNDFKIWRIYKSQNYEHVVKSRIFREVSIYIPDLVVNLNENFILPVLSGYNEDDIIFQSNTFDLEITLEIPVLILDVDLLPNSRGGVSYDTITTTVEFDISRDTVLNMKALSLLGPTNYGQIRILDIKTESGLELKSRDGSVTIRQECPADYPRGILVIGNAQNISASPNPAEDVVNLLIDVTEDGVYDIDIFDMSGRNIQNQIINLKHGHHQLQLDVTSLISGSYFIRFKGTRTVNSLPLIINK